MRLKPSVLALKLATTVLLLVYALHDVSVAEVAKQLGSFATLPVVVALLLIVVQSFLIAVWRWGAILAAGDRGVGRANLARIVAVSLFFNQFLPSTIGGDGARVVMLHGLGNSFGAALRSVVIDRCIGLLALVLLSLAGLGFVFIERLGYASVWSFGAVSLLSVAVFGTVGVFLRVIAVMPVLGDKSSLAAFGKELAALLRKRGMLPKLTLGSALGHLLLSTAIWSSAMSAGVSLPFFESLCILPTVLLATALPISIAGWGVRESSMVIALGLFEVSKGDAVAVSILFGLLHLVVGMGGGLVWIAPSRTSSVEIGKEPVEDLRLRRIGSRPTRDAR